jgi:hypothetical protein
MVKRHIFAIYRGLFQGSVTAYGTVERLRRITNTSAEIRNVTSRLIQFKEAQTFSKNPF